MKCNKCQQQIPGEAQRCPFCGADAPSDLPPAQEERTQKSPGLAKMRRMALLSGVVAAMAVLATVLFLGIRAGWDIGSWFSGGEVTVMDRDSYSVSDGKAWRRRDRQVASMGEDVLTNGQLQIYYWTQVYDFVGNYSYYLTAFGLDMAKPLEEQKLDPENTTLRYFVGPVDGDMTWQQYFLQGAIQTWQSNQAFAQLARENGYELDAEAQKKLDDMPAQLAADAKKAGFDSVDAYLQESMGPGCTQEDYLQYMQTYYLGYGYFAQLYEAIDPTLPQLEAYFAENEEMLRANGITKSMGYTVDVRHILITPDGKVPSGKQEFTDAQWENCWNQANEILDAWLAGEQTEAYFAALAKAHSQDSWENVESGGLYTYVQKGEMEGDFDTWCFAEDRQPGDYGLVKTSYGYHIMYFVDAEDLWLTQTRTMYIRTESQRIVDHALNSHPIEVEYGKIVLGRVKMQ